MDNRGSQNLFQQKWQTTETLSAILMTSQKQPIKLKHGYSHLNAPTRKKTEGKTTNRKNKPHKSNMPRISKKKRYVHSLSKLFRLRLFKRGLCALVDEEDSLEDAIDWAVSRSVHRAENRRYLFRKSRYRKGSDRFEDNLNNLEVVEEDEEDSDISIEAAKLPWLTDEEFLQKYRMSRESFSRLVGLIQDHPVFNPDSRTRKQISVAHQLMVFLRYIGSEGTGATASGQHQTFAIGHGTSDLFRKRVTRTILLLRQQYL
jgi:hypothetical protein